MAHCEGNSDFGAPLIHTVASSAGVNEKPTRNARAPDSETLDYSKRIITQTTNGKLKNIGHRPVVAEMVTFLITSLVILAFIAAAAYFWQKPAFPTKTETLTPPPGRGLFIDGTPDGLALAAAEAASEAIANADQRRTEILGRAGTGEKSTLQEAQATGDALLYDEVLNSLVAVSTSYESMLSLVSLITRHELPVNRRLAERFIESYKGVPNPNATAKMLHLAALSNDAAVYQAAVETALEAWRAGSLTEVSPQKLRAILEGEFWILSSATRSSGAGFLLKGTLAVARRELEAAHNE